MRKLRIFVASPTDTEDQRSAVALVVDELRRSIGNHHGFELEVVRWETHVAPGIGDDSQEVINQSIGEYDVFIGIMWKRFGTPTRRAESGTAEEFRRAYALNRQHGRPKVMFYFRISPFYVENLEDWAQFGEVLRFRKEVSELGVLFSEFDEPLQFERSVREHLTQEALRLISPRFREAPPSDELLIDRLQNLTEKSSIVREVLSALDQALPSDVVRSAIMNALPNEDADALLAAARDLRTSAR